MLPSTDWKEVVPEGEAAQHERLADQLRAFQRKDARGGSPMRALHAKGQAGVEAEFTVLSDLPEHARVGLFATPATYRAYVRFSNGTGTRQSDAKPDVRGMAVKLVGVEGRKLIPGLESAKTQDFLLIRTSSQPFKNADEFLWLIQAARQPALLPLKALAHFGPARGLRILRQMLQGLSMPLHSVATTPYFSALPIRFGPYAVRVSLAPHARAEPGEKAVKGPDALADDLAARLAKGPLVYDFRVQFFRDEATTPIEDASRDWSEADAPYLTLARLTLPQQDLRSKRGVRVADFVERLSFDPWHAQEELRPLGNMMRARNAAYRLSTMERGAIPEPDGTEHFDEEAA